MMTTRIEIARSILSRLPVLKIYARINEAGKATYGPKQRITSELEEQLREYASELRVILLTESEGNEVVERASLPCTRCSGSGREPSALDQWPQIEYLLRGLGWHEARIALLHDEIHTDEALLSVRWGGVDLRSPDGSERTLPREH
jgi:hypothetical protein